MNGDEYRPPADDPVWRTIAALVARLRAHVDNDPQLMALFVQLVDKIDDLETQLDSEFAVYRHEMTAPFPVLLEFCGLPLPDGPYVGGSTHQAGEVG